MEKYTKGELYFWGEGLWWGELWSFARVGMVSFFFFTNNCSCDINMDHEPQNRNLYPLLNDTLFFGLSNV